MKTSAEEHLRTLFRRHAWAFDDRDSWDLNELGRLTGDSLLHHRVSSGGVEDVKLLISRGANVNLPGDMGFTPLHFAVRRDTPDVAEALLSAGANPALKNEWGDTPMTTLSRRERDLPPRVFKQFVKLLRRSAR